MLWRVDALCRFVEVSENYSEFIGKTENWLVGKSGLVVVKPRTILDLMVEHAAAIRQLEPHAGIVWVRYQSTWAKCRFVAEPQWVDNQFAGWVGLNEFIPTPRAAKCRICPFRTRHPGACCRAEIA